ncbi:MAG: TerC family protein [Coriobacteriia bacterium]|nr:TerC family protein [Coriobacteriia bacterium]
MDIQLIMWVVFWVVIAAALTIDLVFLNKHHGDVSFKEAVLMVCVWVGLSLCFCVSIYFTLGPQKAIDYVTGYVVEYSLSIDNMFVFLMLFSYFAIPREHQPKVLMFGILGAVILRFVFIFAGIQLINAFSWIIYIFGALLIFTAIKMVVKKEDEVHPEKNIVIRLLKKILPFTDDSSSGKFFAKENGIRRATPLFAAVVVIEMSDLIFAVDSVPAVLSISTDTFIVYTSNIFAIVGLRSLYFLLANLAARFRYLQTGVAVILLFVGVKMLISHFVHIPTYISLGVIILVLVVSIVASSIIKKKDDGPQ